METRPTKELNGFNILCLFQSFCETKSYKKQYEQQRKQFLNELKDFDLTENDEINLEMEMATVMKKGTFKEVKNKFIKTLQKLRNKEREENG